MNPLHPNDYLARWYGQAMLALFSGERLAGAPGSAEGGTPGKGGGEPVRAQGDK